MLIMLLEITINHIKILVSQKILGENQNLQLFMTSNKQTEQKVQEPIKLTVPKWSKIIDLEKGTHGYNVKVQIIRFEKETIPNVENKKLTLVKAQVGDETGKADLLLRLQNPDLISQSKVIAIRNGRRQILKGHISLQLDAFGKITQEKDDIKASAEFNISEKQLPKREKVDNQKSGRIGSKRQPDRKDLNRNRQGERMKENSRGGYQKYQRQNDNRSRDKYQRRENNKRRDRDYDRKPRRDERQPKTVKVKDVGPGDQDLNILVKVIQLTERVEKNNGRQRTFLDCVLADESGCVNASFYGNDDIRRDDTLNLRNVVAKVVREHIQIQRGRYGRVSQADRDVKNVNTTNDISKKAYVLDK